MKKFLVLSLIVGAVGFAACTHQDKTVVEAPPASDKGSETHQSCLSRNGGSICYQSTTINGVTRWEIVRTSAK